MASTGDRCSFVHHEVLLHQTQGRSMRGDVGLSRRVMLNAELFQTSHLFYLFIFCVSFVILTAQSRWPRPLESWSVLGFYLQGSFSLVYFRLCKGA